MDSEDKNKCIAFIDEPYPSINPQTHRSDYAYAMLSNIGSDNSEMSAISLYFYNSTMLNSKYAEFAECFHNISIVEMHHLNIFASFACQMGLEPRLWCMKNQKPAYWTPAYNYYPTNVRAIIENSIKNELATIQKYTRQAEIIQDSNIVENLNRIIMDERHHVKLFYDMLAKLA